MLSWSPYQRGQNISYFGQKILPCWGILFHQKVLKVKMSNLQTASLKPLHSKSDLGVSWKKIHIKAFSEV